MNTLLIVSLLLNGTTIIFFIFVILKVNFLSKDCIESDSYNEEHCCNDCGLFFVEEYENDFKYCPFCSKKLTLHLNNPKYKDYYKDKE